MSLILALVLIAIVLCKVIGDKSKASAFDREKNEKDKVIAEREKIYVDKDLEDSLEQSIADEREYSEIRDEVSKVLSGMEHWSYLLDGDFPLNERQISSWSNKKQALETLRTNQKIALDILLANRGKVSMMAFAFGYDAYVNNGTQDLKESAYEYAETILKLMRVRGCRVKLYYYRYLSKEAYYWEGTHPQHRNNPSAGEVMLDFDRKILFQRTSIPKADS